MVQCTAYADDLDILSRRERDMKSSFQLLQNESKRAGLSINEDKTKYMEMTRNRGIPRNAIEIDEYRLEKVPSFKYLGSLLTENNENSLEIKERIKAVSKAYFSLQHLLKSKLLSWNSKKLIYRTILRPVVMYASETWVMTSRDEALLNTWETKMLRRIYGPSCRNNEWRIRTNQEIDSLYQEPNLVTEIKRGRLRWLGHVERMPVDRAVSKVHRLKPEGRRQRGRPRKRWLDDVEEDLRSLDVRRWRGKTQDSLRRSELFKDSSAAE